MSNHFSIQSHKGQYDVMFIDGLDLKLDKEELQSSHVIIDKKLSEIYPQIFEKLLSAMSCLLIEAEERNKSLEQMPVYVEHLIKNKIRRNHKLIAVGGGIIQDITCFLAANLLRGIDWWFIPTTLLAQADSCIGSKSSINCGECKNILGTFTPPQRIMIHLDFLKTLDIQAIRSGVGEMLKVHAIDGEESFNSIANDYQSIFQSPQLMAKYIHRSLEIKKHIIEKDEFDRDLRHVMNYGHTFGHAIESATHYEIPHGIAVSIGMDMANYIAMHANITSSYHYERMQDVLRQNYIDYSLAHIPLDLFLTAISKDKKNIGNDNLTLILPNQKGLPSKVLFPFNNGFQEMCARYLTENQFLISG